MPKRKRDVEIDRDDLESIIEMVLKKKQKKIEEENVEIVLPPPTISNTEFDLDKTQKQIETILGDIIFEDIEKEITGHTQGLEQPIYTILYKIGFPNTISVKLVQEIANLQGVVSVAVTEHDVNIITLKVVMSNDASLKTSFAYKDFAHHTKRLKAVVKGKDNMHESVFNLIKSNLDLQDDHEANKTKEKVNHNGNDISILSYAIKGPVSFHSMNRLILNPIILNLNFGSHKGSNCLVATFELCNVI
jgi:hypothetical protein